MEAAGARIGWLEKATGKKNGTSRGEIYERKGFDLSISAMGISVDAGGYLLEIAKTLGWAHSFGYGITPLSFHEIRSYAELTGEIKEGWESKAIRRISESFCKGYQDESGIDPAFWIPYEGLIPPLVPIKGTKFEGETEWIPTLPS